MTAAMWAAGWVGGMDTWTAAKMVVGSAVTMVAQLAASMEQWMVEQTAAAMVRLTVAKTDTWMAAWKVQSLVASTAILSVE